MFKKIAISLIGATAALVACESGMEGRKTGTGEPGYPNGGRGQLILMAGSSDADFQIESVSYDRFKDDTLRVGVVHPIECDGDFEFYWDGSVAESYPPQVYLVLKFNGSCPDNRLAEKSLVEADLKTILNSPDLSGDVIVHVVNGSVTYATNDQTFPTTFQ